MSAWPVRRLRDVTLIDGPDGSTVVVACDSVGGIGPRPGDMFSVDARTVTHFAARVPILEVLSTGASPTVIVDTLSIERGPTANEMIEEVRALARELGLDPDTSVTGSTEDNVATSATALGITVVGVAGPGRFRPSSAGPGDLVVAVGLPLSAPRDRLVPGDPRMPSIAEVRAIAALPGIHEVLPVGSRGIAHEISQLVATQGLLARDAGPGLVDRERTAGPSTCVLAAVSPHALDDLRLRDDLPLELVASVDTERSTERPHL